jgi:hypothetical protein
MLYYARKTGLQNDYFAFIGTFSAAAMLTIISIVSKKQ